MNFRLSLIALALVFSPLTSAAPSTAPATGSANLEKAIQIPVEKYTLANGLVVMLHPDPSLPAVSVQTWFRVGSKDEQVGLTGLAHFFEHMMFKGTAKYPMDTWGKYLNGKGAETNAFTSGDYTGYYINAPNENLPLILDIEADRMRNLLLDPKQVTSEREVVKEERRMRYEDNIEGGIHEKMSELMFTKLPYRWLTIGHMADLNAATMDDLKAFYKSFYSPNNAVLVVAGSFDTAQVKKWIEKSHGKLPREEIKRPPVTQDEPQTKERRAVIEREAQAPTIAIGYKLPEMNHIDHYALDLLSNMLGTGQSSRLHKRLVRKAETAMAAGTYSWGQILAGRFVAQVSLKPNQDIEKTIQVVEEEIKRMRTVTVTQKELQKARTLFMKDYVDGLKRLAGRARMLASYEILYGDHTRLFTDLKKYQEVTPADIQRVAKLYLKPEQRNIVIVHPKTQKVGAL